MSTKDTITKEYLQNNERFADIINYCLFDGKQIVLPSGLSERDSTEVFSLADDNLSASPIQMFRDLFKFSIVKQSASATFVLFGLELQDQVHYAMPVRTFLYDALQYSKQVKSIGQNHKTADYDNGAEFLSKFKKTDHITPVVTLTLFLSPYAWDGPRSLHDMMEHMEPSVKQFVNDYPLHLIIPCEIQDFDKFRTETGALLEFIKASHSKESIQKLLRSQKKYQNLDRETILTIKSITNTRLKLHAAGGKEDMGNVWENMTNEIKTEGRDEARSEFADAVKLIRKGVNTPEELISNGISKETAETALDAMLQPI